MLRRGVATRLRDGGRRRRLLARGGLGLGGGLECGGALLARGGLELGQHRAPPPARQHCPGPQEPPPLLRVRVHLPQHPSVPPAPTNPARVSWRSGCEPRWEHAAALRSPRMTSRSPRMTSAYFSRLAAVSAGKQRHPDRTAADGRRGGASARSDAGHCGARTAACSTRRRAAQRPCGSAARPAAATAWRGRRLQRRRPRSLGPAIAARGRGRGSAPRRAPGAALRLLRRAAWRRRAARARSWARARSAG